MNAVPSSKENRCLAIFVRHPEPGKVKTRLARSRGGAFAAELYGCFVDDLLEALGPGKYRITLFFDPPEKGKEIRKRFGSGFEWFPQEGEGLGERMANAFRNAFSRGFSSCLLIGSDFPDLTAAVIDNAFAALEKGADAAIGPALDGGYYLIGFRSDRFLPALFEGMAWGKESVFEETWKQMNRLGYRIHLAPAWRDMDREEDLRELEVKHRDTDFSRSRTMAYLRQQWRPDSSGR